MNDETPHTPPRLSDLVRDLRHFLVVANRRGLLKVPMPPDWSPAAPAAAPQGVVPERAVDGSAPRPAPPAPPAQTAPPERPSHDIEPERKPEWVPGNEAGRTLPPLGKRPPALVVVADTSHPAVPVEGTRQERLDAFYKAVGACQRCGLAKGRSTIVFGSGNPDSGVMLVGEGPGRFEDEQGLPFVGRSGQLLTRMLAAAGLDREKDLFITNVVKCRPPNNRDPETQESAACSFILNAQIEIIQPKVIVIAGLQAAKALLGPNVTLTGVRQKRQRLGETDAIVTFHPSFLLRQPAKKGEAFRDLVALRRLMAHVGLADPVPNPWWL